MPFQGEENDLNPLTPKAKAPVLAPSPQSKPPRFIGEENDLAPAARPQAQETSLFERAIKTIDDIGRSFATGAFGELADEFAAGMSNLTGIGGKAPAGATYEERLAAERARDEEISPYVGLPAEIGGGVAAAVAAAPIAHGTRLVQAASRLPGWARASGLGAFFGGLYGFGAGEGGAEERAKSAAGGALTGGIGTGALYPAAQLTRMGAGKLAGEIRGRVSPVRQARQKVAEAFERDVIPAHKARLRLRELGPQATLADVGGRNVQGVARATAGIPGPAMQRAEQTMMQRAAGESERISKSLGRGLGSEDFYAAEDAFIRNLREQASPLYKEAYQAHQSIMTPPLKRLLQSRVAQQALKESAFISEAERAAGAAKYLGAVDDELTAAARYAAELGKLPSVGRPGVARGFSLETWDQIKRGFDALLDRPAYRNELTGRLNKRGFAVDQMRRRLVKELDKATGGPKGSYAKARAVYSGDAEVVDALRAGRKALNQDPEIITRELAKLSKAGQEAYRTGAARALKDVLDKTPDTSSAARRVFGNARARSRLRALFPKPEDYRALSRLLNAEMRFAQTKNYVLGGSPTAEKLAGQEDLLTRAAGAAGLMAGSSGELMLASMRRKAAEALVGRQSDKFNRELAKMLFSRNIAENQRALDVIFERAGMGNLGPAAKREFGALLLPVLVGQQTGRTSAAVQSGQ